MACCRLCTQAVSQGSAITRSVVVLGRQLRRPSTHTHARSVRLIIYMGCLFHVLFPYTHIRGGFSVRTNSFNSSTGQQQQQLQPRQSRIQTALIAITDLFRASKHTRGFLHQYMLVQSTWYGTAYVWCDVGCSVQLYVLSLIIHRTTTDKFSPCSVWTIGLSATG